VSRFPQIGCEARPHQSIPASWEKAFGEKTVRRETIEAQFEAIVRRLRPSEEVFATARATFRLWGRHLASENEARCALSLFFHDVLVSSSTSFIIYRYPAVGKGQC
jgi:hypothetical protein